MAFQYLRPYKLFIVRDPQLLLSTKLKPTSTLILVIKCMVFQNLRTYNQFIVTMVIVGIHSGRFSGIRAICTLHDGFINNWKVGAAKFHSDLAN